MKFKQKYFIGIGAGLVVLLLDFYLFFVENGFKVHRFFFPVLIIALSIGWSQFWIDFINENKRQKDIEVKFLDFIRNLVGAVRSGVSIPQAVLNVVDKDYGALNPYLRKLGNQVELGIPLKEALLTFSEDTDNGVVKRSIAIVIEAEASGGNMEDVLESVSQSVVDVKKVKAERKSSVHSQVVQGYIVFFVFIGIMLLLQVKLFPMLTEFGNGAEDIGNSLGGIMNMGGEGDDFDLDMVFFALVIVQGFFTGIMIGKFSEGTLKNGLIHSLVLVTMGILIITTVKGGI